MDTGLAGTDITQFLALATKTKRRLIAEDKREFDGMLHHSFVGNYPDQLRWWKKVRMEEFEQA